MSVASAAITYMQSDSVVDRARRDAVPSRTGKRTSDVRLVRRELPTPQRREWAPEVGTVFACRKADPGWRPWRVTGAAGTGKTSLLVDLAVDRIAAGMDPASLLVLTHSKAAAVRVRGAITRELAGGVPGATRQPLVRTVHSYAFALLRTAAALHGNPPPRLLTGTEQDAVLREMLQGEVDDAAAGAGLPWPQRLYPALGTGGFAEQLRDLMLRATERGLGPEDLVALGRRHDRTEWVAAGRFAQRYEQAVLLRWSVGVAAPEASAPALDAAELVGAAVDALAGDATLLAAERERLGCLLVDDAQHLDPMAAVLIQALGSGPAMTVLAGDPNQAVYSFRGADSGLLTGRPLIPIAGDSGGDRDLVLRTDYRCAPAVHAAVARLASRFPGAATIFADGAEGDAGRVRVRVVGTPAKEAAVIADQLRRAHLTEGVPWERMAVIVRSVPLMLPPLRRALLAAGVPVRQPKPDVPLARRRGVSWMLLALRAMTSAEPATRGFTVDDAVELVTGPLGGADRIALRRLRRGIRRTLDATETTRGADGGGVAVGDRSSEHSDSTESAEVVDAQRSSAEVLRDMILGVGEAAVLEGLTEEEAAPLRRVRHAVRAAEATWRDGAGVESVLWELWVASGLEQRWVAQSRLAGAAGMQADRDLDAVMALFDAAAGYVDRLPHATVAGFVEYLEHQHIPQDALVTNPRDAVAILSAHAAVGREWDVVAVAGVQEGLWPNPRPRGTLLAVEDFVDVLAGVTAIGEAVSRTAPIVAEERRLLMVACSRARRSLLVTAVESSAGDHDLVPSRFLAELDPSVELGEPGRLLPAAGGGRALVMQALLAELRSVVCNPGDDPQQRRRAARELARLARAGVPGAHPDQWYGLAQNSSQLPLCTDEDGPVTLSPSTVEMLRTCPLRWALERHGGGAGDNARLVAGNLVHTLVQALAGQAGEAQVRAALIRAWRAFAAAGGTMGAAASRGAMGAAATGSESWHTRQDLRSITGMLDTFLAWLRNTRTELTVLGVEVPVDCLLPAAGPDQPAVRIRGRVDRVERDALGRPVIVDVKTGRTPISKQAAEDHAQLATYQIATAAGALDALVGPPAAGRAADCAGGARLVYVAKPHSRQGATERLQQPLDAQAVARWRQVVHEAAAATFGPSYLAVRNDGCRHCSVATSCPLGDAGGQVTQR